MDGMLINMVVRVHLSGQPLDTGGNATSAQIRSCHLEHPVLGKRRAGTGADMAGTGTDGAGTDTDGASGIFRWDGYHPGWR